MLYSSGKTHAGRTQPLSSPPEGRRAAPRPPAQDEIARLAYAFWEARGRVGGSAEGDWLRAERELCHSKL